MEMTPINIVIIAVFIGMSTFGREMAIEASDLFTADPVTTSFLPKKVDSANIDVSSSSGAIVTETLDAPPFNAVGFDLLGLKGDFATPSTPSTEESMSKILENFEKSRETERNGDSSDNSRNAAAEENRADEAEEEDMAFLAKNIRANQERDTALTTDISVDGNSGDESVNTSSTTNLMEYVSTVISDTTSTEQFIFTEASTTVSQVITVEQSALTTASKARPSEELETTPSGTDTTIDGNWNSPLCASINELPTFVRHTLPATRRVAAPNFVRKMDSLAVCADRCRRNVDPLSGGPFRCNGFVYAASAPHRGVADNSCELYNDHVSPLRSSDNESAESVSNKWSHLQFSQPQPTLLNYFERMCLAIPDECAQSAFSYESYSKKCLVLEPVEAIMAKSRKRCLDFCLTNTACHAVNYNPLNGTCQVLDRGWRLVAGGLVDDPEFDYYENTCFQASNRCTPQRRIDFLVTRNAELETFDVSAEQPFRPSSSEVAASKGSIRSCMRQCVEASDTLFCRSFHYNSTTGECRVGVEGFYQVAGPPPQPNYGSGGGLISLAITSDRFDVYEPICLDESVELPCEGEHVFERFTEMNLMARGGDDNRASLIDGIAFPNATLENCMEFCLYNDSCLSFVYMRLEQSCTMLAHNRDSAETLPLLEPRVDYYELACQRRPVATTTVVVTAPLSSETISIPLLADFTTPSITTTAGNSIDNVFTTLRTEPQLQMDAGAADNNEARVTPTTEDDDTDDDAPQIIKAEKRFHDNDDPSWNQRCRDVGNASTTRLISRGRTLRLEYRNLHHVNVYGISQCEALCRDTPINCVTFAYNANTRDCLLSTNEIHGNGVRFSLFTQSNPHYDLYSYNFTDGMRSCIGAEKTSTTKEIDNNESSSAFSITTPSSALSFTAEPLQPLISSDITNPRMFAENEFRQPLSTDPEPLDLSSEKKGAEHGDSLRPHRVRTQTKVDGSKLTVDVDCQTNGANVTFTLGGNSDQTYNGAVYAAERFAHCHAVVHRQRQFSLFIQRPSTTDRWECNALEEADQLSAVLVVSNDMVEPLDVTTREDLFYQITCYYGPDMGQNLSSSASGEKHAKRGETVRGPYPELVFATTTRAPPPSTTALASYGETNDDGWDSSRVNASFSGDDAPEDHQEATVRRVNLKILRDGHPVSNVYIGERLSALVAAGDIDVSRLSVMDCNATRVLTDRGRHYRRGSHDSSDQRKRYHIRRNGDATVQLIRNGCTRMPEIIGNMARGSRGLEAPFTAFRIDGSHQIDIVCSVVVCRNRCADLIKKQDCPSASLSLATTASSSFQSKWRTRRGEESSVAELSRGGGGSALAVNRPNYRDGNMDMVTVDQRLHILVASPSFSGEDGEDDDRKEDQQSEENAFELDDDEEAMLIGQDEEINNSPPIVVVTSSRGGIKDLSSATRFREPSSGSVGVRPKTSNSPTDLLQMIMEMDTVAEANFEYCMNPLILLLLIAALVLCAVALVISVLAHLCGRRRRRMGHHRNGHCSVATTTTAMAQPTEMSGSNSAGRSSNGGGRFHHIPRVERYMA